MTKPVWLKGLAASYWEHLAKAITVTPQTRDLLACLCECHAEYREAIEAGDSRSRKQCLDHIFKYSKELGLFKTTDAKPVEDGELW